MQKIIQNRKAYFWLVIKLKLIPLSLVKEPDFNIIYYLFYFILFFKFNYLLLEHGTVLKCLWE